MSQHVLLAACLLLVSFVVSAQPAVNASEGPNVPLEYFTRPSQVLDIQLSPDGAHLAILSLEGRRGVVLIVARQGLKPSHKVFFEDDAGVGTFNWVNNERLVFSKVYYSPQRKEPYSLGELYAVNADGTRPKYIFGLKRGKRDAGRISSGPSLFSGARMLDLLPDNERHILVATKGFSQGSPSEVYKLNVYNGRAKKIARAPTPVVGFLTDQAGQVRIALGMDAQGSTHLWHRASDNSDWAIVETFEISKGGMVPVSFSSNNEDVYVVDYSAGETGALVRFNMLNREKEKVFQHNLVDPTQFLFDKESKAAYAVVLDPGHRQIIALDQSKSSQMIGRLNKSFPGYVVTPISQDAALSRTVIEVANAQTPTSYYLYDHAEDVVEFLMSSRPWVEAAKSSEVRYVEVTARDGLRLAAYLTIPKFCTAVNKCPMIVNPHGGPHGVRDYATYNPEAQAFASRKYIVLQVNFRGSGGYGFDFMSRGFQEWGRDIQFDIVDATKQVIESDQSPVDADRVCIYGASFGAYSALQSPIVEPGLYKCAIGAAGVYDLSLLYEKGDVPSSLSGEAYLNLVVGSDEGSMRDQSPVFNASRIDVPVLLLHGEKDERAPVEHALRMADSLKAAGRPYEISIFDGEGHGYFDPANQLLALQRVIRFLDDQTQD